MYIIICICVLKAIFNNDVNSLAKYVQRKNDCNLHTGVLAPLTMAAAAGATGPAVACRRESETSPAAARELKRRLRE